MGKENKDLVIMMEVMENDGINNDDEARGWSLGMATISSSTNTPTYAFAGPEVPASKSKPVMVWSKVQTAQ
jgi:hypothetical protein